MKVVRTSEPIIARSASFLWWKRIYIGEKFDRLSTDEKYSVIAHELAHCEGHHTEIRMLFMFIPFLFSWICRQQEYSADKYAKDRGYGASLARVISRNANNGPYYPSTESRCARLAPVMGLSPG